MAVRPGAERIFLAESVAIVGASDAKDGFSAALCDNLRERFDGRLYFINPRRTEVFGEACQPDFAHVGEPIDLALVVTPGAAVAEILEEGAAHGLRAALLYNEAFGLPGSAEDARDAERIRQLCARNALRVAGPNSLGALAPARGGTFYPIRSMRGLPAGNVGLISASGGALQHWMLQGAARGLGFSYAISTGNELDLGLSDYMEFLARDDATRVICVIAEGVRDPRAFARAAASALAARKPVAILKSGRSAAAARAAASHTGALAGDDRVFDAVCERYGLCRVASLDELLEIALAFRTGRIPHGDGVAMLCHSGGIKGTFLDAAEHEGLRLAELAPQTRERLRALGDFPVDNPLDGGMRLALRADEYGAVARACASDPDVDLIALQGRLPTKEAHSPHKLAAYNELFAAVGKPIVAFERMAYNVDRETSAASPMPFLQGIPETARALAALVKYGRVVRRAPYDAAAVETVAPPREAPPAGAAERLRDSLRANGVTFAREAFAAGRDEAFAAARALGYPLVLKAASASLHKTELDAVRTGIRDEAELGAALDAIAANLARAGVAGEGFVLQEVAAGVELLVGARTDAQFGPIVVAGLGGVAAEALHDVAIRLLPIERADALAMLGELRGRAVLDAFRGRPQRDRDAIAAAIAGVGATLLEHRAWLADLEINPLIAGPAGAGAYAVDLRFTTHAEESP